MLSVEAGDKQAKSPHDVTLDSANQRMSISKQPEPVLASLRWPGRPCLQSGNASWTYMIETPDGEFALFIGELKNDSNRPLPFEVWVNGVEQPRGLGAVAKTLSMDMRANDTAWLRLKLETLSKIAGEKPFECHMPPHGELVLVPGSVAAMAKVVHWHCEQMGALEEGGATPVLNAMLSPEEPLTGPDGTLSWTVDIHNPAAHETFVLGLKETTLADGTTRPYSCWLSGNYPRALDGLTRLLSLDMRVIDPAWIGMKLRKLTSYPEPLGGFMAFEPGSRRQKHWPSTVAYLARLIMHRYAMLDILDENGYPRREMGILQAPTKSDSKSSLNIMKGRQCMECGNSTVIKRDGCDFCTACGVVGACG